MKKLNVAFLAIAFLFSCSNEQEKLNSSSYLFETVSPESSGIEFANIVTEDAEHNIISYIYYYNGGGVATGDVNNDGLSDLFFVSNMGNNKLYLNKGDLKFEDISDKANISGNASWQTGVTLVDINNDGFLDIYICAVSEYLDFKGHNELYINNGDNTFTEKAKDYGLDFKGYSTQSYFFDYDKDGDLDAYLVNHAVHTSLSHGKAELRHKREPLTGDVLLKNDNGQFIDVSEEANIYGGINGYGLSATIADFNNDGWDDIYVCNDFHEDDYYYINQKDGKFKEQLAKSFTTISRFSMGSDASDINGDGYQDLMTLDMLPRDEVVLKETEGDDSMFNMQVHLNNLGYKDQYSRNMLQMNNSGEFFQETAILNNVADTDWSWSPLFADYNNDGYQDLFVSNGILRRPNGLDFKKYISSAFKGRSEAEGLAWLYNSINEMASGKVTNEIFEGNSKTFKRQTGNWIKNQPNISNGAIYVDLDLDGDLDIVKNNYGETASLLENTTKNKNYIELDFIYKDSNIEGIGSKVIIYTNKKRQLKQLFKSRGFMSSFESKIHFGLGQTKTIDSLEIIWPNNEVQIIKNPEINQSLSVSYKPSNNVKDYDNSKQKSTIFKKKDLIEYTHTEDLYNDFAEEKLIPYKISMQGPAVAIGDIDNDGYEDLFLGNASDKVGTIFKNTGTRFIETKQTVLEQDAAFEDNDAVFFDADNDGDLDLYVASGVNERKDINYQHDRLYINNDGTYVKAQNQIPENTLVTSTVSASDYDQDGDIDLFIGILADANDFGKLTTSYILNNDGKGNFTIDNEFELTSKVTDAKWEDINDDGLSDLIVATEWDTPKIYLNSTGGLELISLSENYKGLWQSINTFDIDNDGDKDILLGNWGTNTKLSLNTDGPLKMYHNDFDENGKFETLLAYSKNGVYYPLNSKDEMAGQMNLVNKVYTDHKSYAGKPFDKIILPNFLNESTIYEAITFATSYLKNDNGEYKEVIQLPDAFQMAPVNTFSKINIGDKPQLIVAGNSYKVNTYHGSYTSLKGLLVNDITKFKSISTEGISPFDGQIKQLETIKMKDKNILIVVTNNDDIRTYTFQD